MGYAPGTPSAGSLAARTRLSALHWYVIDVCKNERCGSPFFRRSTGPKMKGAFTKSQKCFLLYSFAVALSASFFLTVRSLASEPLLEPGANVVLLSGLPGDLESESSYRDQLQSWLEIIQASRPRSLHVLADNPGPLPSKIDAQPA